MRILRTPLVLLLAGPRLLFAAPGPDLTRAQFRKTELPPVCRIEFRADRVGRGLLLLFNHHGAKSYGALRLGAEGAALFEVRDGVKRDLPVKLPTGTRGTLFLRPGHVLVQLDGHAAAAALTVPSGGKYGAELGTGRLASLVMRREEPIYVTDDFMRAEGTGEHWSPLAGQWFIRSESDAQRSANPFRCVARSAGIGLLTTGEHHWHEYVVSGSAAGRSGTAGLAFAVKDARNFHVFRLGIGRGAAELVRVRDGKEHVLAAADQVLHPHGWYRLSVRADGAGTVCSVDGSPLIRSPVLAPVGQVGLFVTDADEVLFDDVEIASAHLTSRARPPVELFSRVFESDREMENWASLWSAWRPQTLGARGRAPRRVFWHKGDFFGDVSIGWRAPAEFKGRGEITLLVGGDGRDPRRGGTLSVRCGDDGVTWTLAVDGRTLASHRADVPARALLALAREGGCLVARAGDKVVLRTGRVELPGRAVALWSDAGRLDLHRVEIRSDHVYDYLFEQAPTDWFAPTGTWQITNRWVCDPRWSWLGGASSQVAQMWTKRAFHGDQTVEFFAALKMQPGVRYPHVGDINLTLCGDGRNLDSGYQVIFAGWGNRWTRLLRQGRIVAGSGDAIIRGDFHRRWFHIKVRKRGSLVQLFIDDELIRQYRDPQPIDGGQIALWTVDNGIMVARVRVYAERSRLCGRLAKAVKPAPRPPKAGAETPPEGYFALDTFQTHAGGWANRHGDQGARLELVPGGGLMLRNQNAGGSFGATLCDRPFDLLRYPVLDLRYKVVSEEPVRLNLFARVNGRLFELPLTAPPSARLAIPLKGAPPVTFHGKPDGRVRRARIDLGAILTQWYQARQRRPPPALRASELFLANASNRDYLLCGFGGNRAGARLCVTRFAIRARPEAGGD